jgi:hypothetical protein
MEQQTTFSFTKIFQDHWSLQTTDTIAECVYIFAHNKLLEIKYK